ncbi:glycosyltransferase [bacterium]|nr:glycosyltransferase [bacterium]
MSVSVFSDNSAVAVAFSCRPDSGSEWGVGWNYLIILSRLFGTVKIYIRDSENQKKMVSLKLKQLKVDNVDVVYVGDTALYKFLQYFKLHNKLFMLVYASWVLRVFGLQIKNKDWRIYDFTFHLTWVSDWFPSIFFLLPFRNKILGPIGSQGGNFNKKSSDYFQSWGRYYLKLIFRFNPLNFLIALCVDGVVGINSQMVSRLPWSLVKLRCFAQPVHVETQFNYTRSISEKKSVTFVGKNIAFKNLDIFISISNEYLHQHKDTYVEIFGDMLGETDSILQAYDTENRDRVKFFGVINQEELLLEISNKKTILFQPTSETGGTIGVECISLGVPVICGDKIGLDAFFDPGTYKHSLPFNQLGKYYAVSKELDRIFDNYITNSEECIELSGKLSIEQTQFKLKQLIGNILSTQSYRR